jgi:hypothetical protein
MTCSSKLYNLGQIQCPILHISEMRTNNSFREGTDQLGQRLLITIKKAVAIWVGMK